MKEVLEELEIRRNRARAGGGTARTEAQHKRGKLHGRFFGPSGSESPCVDAVYRRLTPDKIVEIIANGWDKEPMHGEPQTDAAELAHSGWRRLPPWARSSKGIDPSSPRRLTGSIRISKRDHDRLFWVGEAADAENDYISNHESYRDKEWLSGFGGVDDPIRRNGHWPAGFTRRTRSTWRYPRRANERASSRSRRAAFPGIARASCRS